MLSCYGVALLLLLYLIQQGVEHEGQLFFPAGFAVGAAGHDAAGQVDAPGHQLAAQVGEFPADALVVAHLPGAVVHVQHRAGGKLCTPHKAGKLIRRHPDGGGKCCGTAVSIVILQQGIQAHQSAHAAAADKGICPVRQGAEILVDQRLEPVDEPAHGGLSLAVKVTVGGTENISESRL